jgi:hypothetical protein
MTEHKVKRLMQQEVQLTAVRNANRKAKCHVKISAK